MKFPVTPTPDQLERLHHKLDFTNTTTAQLDIILKPFAPHLAANHGFHTAQGLERTEIHILAVNKWPQALHQHLPSALVASHNPSLDHRVTLPVTPLVLIIRLEGGKTQRQCATLAIGPQAHVHTEDKAVRRNLIQGLDQSLPQADEKLLIINGTRAAPGFPLPGKGEDQVDIRRDVQLPTTQFAHTQHHHGLGGLLSRDRVNAPGCTRLFAGVFMQPAQSALYASFRKPAGRGHGFVEISPTHQITPDDAKLAFSPVPAQRRVQGRFVRYACKILLPALLEVFRSRRLTE